MDRRGDRVTYALVRTPRQGAPFHLLLTGSFEWVMAAWTKLDVRQGTAEVVSSEHPEPLTGCSAPNLRTRW